MLRMCYTTPQVSKAQHCTPRHDHTILCIMCPTHTCADELVSKHVGVQIAEGKENSNLSWLSISPRRCGWPPRRRAPTRSVIAGVPPPNRSRESTMMMTETIPNLPCSNPNRGRHRPSSSLSVSIMLRVAPLLRSRVAPACQCRPVLPTNVLVRPDVVGDRVYRERRNLAQQVDSNLDNAAAVNCFPAVPVDDAQVSSSAGGLAAFQRAPGLTSCCRHETASSVNFHLTPTRCAASAVNRVRPEERRACLAIVCSDVSCCAAELALLTGIALLCARGIGDRCLLRIRRRLIQHTAGETVDPSWTRVPLLNSYARSSFSKMILADPSLLPDGASVSLFGGLGSSFNYILNGVSGSSAGVPHRQMKVLTAAHRIFNMILFGIFPLQRMSFGPLMKN